MNRRILRLKGQGGVDRFLGARDVACRVVAPLIGHAVKQGVRQDRQRADILRVKGKRALRQRHGLVGRRLAVWKISRLTWACIARSAASGLPGRSRIDAQGFGLDELDAERIGEAGDDLDL